jgi:hypothetical protein
MDQRSSLPETWTDRIFDKLALTYGAAWLKKWEGMDLAAVKADWGHELRGFQMAPQSLRYGLEHLPADFPPTVLQFRELCIKRPEFVADRLPAPKVDEAVVKAVVEGIQRVRDRVNPRQWAYDLQEREKEGDRLTNAQRSMWREALRTVDERALMGFRDIPPECLPPGGLRAEP